MQEPQVVEPPAAAAPIPVAAQQAEQPVQEQAPEQEPLQQPAPKPEIRRDTAKRVHTVKWPPEVPLNPLYTFDTLIASTNRFAHAAANSVVESPGAMYNPLVLFGPSGSGKTHFLTAIAYGLSNQMGQENIYFADGVRFSRGIHRLVKMGRTNEVEDLITNTKALFIDDVHLMAITPENKDLISKWLNTFIASGRQIVLSSAYAPKNLAKLEETLKFQLNSGWMVELKHPTRNGYNDILHKMFDVNAITFSEEEVVRFFTRDQMPLSGILRRIHEMKKMEKLMSARDRAPTHLEILNTITGADEVITDPMLTSTDLEKAKAFLPPKDGVWGKWAFFAPKGDMALAQWMAYSTAERAKSLGLEGGFELQLIQEYETSSLIASAFHIGDACDGVDLQGAVILLPQPTTADKAARDEFSDILTHTLETMLIPCAMIEQEKLKSPASYARTLMDII